jgi:hypothetical protein
MLDVGVWRKLPLSSILRMMQYHQPALQLYVVPINGFVFSHKKNFVVVLLKLIYEDFVG